METIVKDDILALGISVFKLIGESKRHDTDKLYIKLFRFINCVAYIWNLIIILGSIRYAHGYGYIRVMEGTLSCSHALLKYVCFLYYKPDIEKLLDDLQKFWRIKKVEEIYRPARMIYKYLLIAQKVYLVGGFTVVFIYALRPWYENESRFVFECWPVFDSVLMETIVLFSQYYFLVIFVPIIYAFDNLYMSYSIHVILQLRLLKYTFQHVVSGYDISSCIKQHQLLLTIFERIKRIYFWMLLFQYFVTLITGCTQLYILFLGEPAAMEIVASSIYVFAVFIEFGLYTFPVEEIAFELTDISRGIYMSSWYERHLSEKKAILFVMMGAQRQKYLSAGGMINMNIDTFGSVVRKVFSFYIILRNILNK